MLNRVLLAVAGAVAIFAAIGCGASQPEHVEQPMTERPPLVSPFKSLKTKEEKIKYIQDSKAPDSEKQAAIEKINAGQL